MATERKKLPAASSPKPTEGLITKYRPTDWEYVVGHDAVIRSLKKVVEDGSARAFTFSGNFGSGKTSLARLVAKKLGCGRIQEIDAASNSGIDAMREVTRYLDYKPLDQRPVMVIIDEAHGLSKQAWDSLLKATEEPSPWVYWCFCTTLIGKMPKAMVSRSAHYDLKPVAPNVLRDLLDEIVECESETVIKGLTQLCAKMAEGSPRQAIANLTKCMGVKDLDEAYDLLEVVDDNVEIRELAHALNNGKDWGVLKPIVEKLGEQAINPESIRRMVRAYITKAMMSTKGGKLPANGLVILEAFDKPFDSSEGMAPVVLAIGNVLFNGGKQ